MSDLEAELHHINQRLGQLSDGRVLSAAIVGRRIEIEVELTPDGRKVWAELCVASGGQGGGVFRVPSPGDTVQVLLIDADPTDARVIGWTPTGAMGLPEDVEAGATYLVAVPGENLRLIASRGGRLKIATDAGDLLEELSKALQELISAFSTLSADVATPTLFGTSKIAGAASYGKASAALGVIKGVIDAVRE